MTDIGNLPASALTTVQGSIQLANAPGASFKRVHAATGWTIEEPAGGYRTEAVQNAMSAAGAGHDQAAKARWGLDPTSTVAIARHPNGTHEDGTSADLGGFPITDANLALLATHGWTRPFGNSDPRHFHYDATHDQHKAAPAPKPAPAKVPAPAPAGKTVVAKNGDSLSKIAAAHGLTLPKIEALNPQVKGPKFAIAVGDAIRVS